METIIHERGGRTVGRTPADSKDRAYPRATACQRRQVKTDTGHLLYAEQSTTIYWVLFGYMEGVRCRGRDSRSGGWITNITVWTGVSIGDGVKMTRDLDVWRSFNGP